MLKLSKGLPNQIFNQSNFDEPNFLQIPVPTRKNEIESFEFGPLPGWFTVKDSAQGSATLIFHIDNVS